MIFAYFFSSPGSSQSTDLPNSRLMAARLIFLPPRLVIATVLLKAKSLLALFRKFPIFPRWPDRGSQDSLDRHLYRPRHVFPLPLPLQPLELGQGTLQAAVVQRLVFEGAVESCGVGMA